MTTTLHAGTTFLVCDDAGQVAGGAEGLYYEGARFLSRLELLLDGAAPLSLTLLQPSARDSVAVATNPELRGAPRGKLEIIRRRRLSHDALTEELAIRNYGDQSAHFTLSLRLAADFKSLFRAKTQTNGCGGAEGHETVHDGGKRRVFRHEAGDMRLETNVALSEPSDADGADAFEIDLPRHGLWTLNVCVEARIAGRAPSRRTAGRRSHEAWTQAHAMRTAAPVLETDHETLRIAYRTAAEDIVALRIKSAESEAYEIAGGIPWHMALFGRDSLVTSFQTMLHDPSIARGSLRALAELQGTHVDPDTLEEAGRILHEHRRGVAIRVDEAMPPFPHYGTIDATPLFLIVLSEYARVTGDLAFVHAMWPHVERALQWIRRSGDRDGDGLVEYDPGPGATLQNLAWKDSDGSMRFRDGTVAEPPIAPVEVQGYVVEAFRRTAELCVRLERPGAGDLLDRADRLASAIGERYWLGDRGTFAEALDGRKSPVDALTSNPGHLLWAGAVPVERAARVADTLLSPDLFSGFGVRTMGSAEGGYSPISYHCGSVWPHDNSLILHGLARYRLDAHVRQLANGLLASLACYPHGRWPELYDGYGRDQFARPVAYAGANSPQAWATGAVMLLVRSILGLSVDALTRTVSARPVGVDGMSFLRLRGLLVGAVRTDVEARFDARGARLSITRLPDGWTWDRDGDRSTREAHLLTGGPT